MLIASRILDKSINLNNNLNQDRDERPQWEKEDFGYINYPRTKSVNIKLDLVKVHPKDVETFRNRSYKGMKYAHVETHNDFGK